ncbi:MAG: hypothetical protein EPN75_08790 [Beijerinckiaceae bacterium]|nr:MAG: hypothetical protein EPN75_08790 [Beijerinckiaceae bacterium]
MAKCPIAIPEFRVSLDNFVIGSGWPQFWIYGKGPALEDIVGWNLVMWPEQGGRMVFGGLNEGLVGYRYPVVDFFRLEGVALASQGLIDSFLYCDIILFDEATRELKENYLFTFFPRDVILGRSFHVPKLVPVAA